MKKKAHYKIVFDNYFNDHIRMKCSKGQKKHMKVFNKLKLFLAEFETQQ